MHIFGVHHHIKFINNYLDLIIMKLNLYFRIFQFIRILCTYVYFRIILYRKLNVKCAFSIHIAYRYYHWL